MRRLVLLVLVALAAIALVCGCAKTQDKVVVRITDNEGKLPPRTITVAYVNDRLENMMAPYIPDIAGVEGKKRLLEDVIRKELLVTQALRLGLDKDPQQASAREYYMESYAEQMLQDELIVKPSVVTQEEVEAYYAVRDATFQIREIVVATKEEADAVYKRVTEGAEDFARVAGEVSTSVTAKDGGTMPVMAWMDFHPLVRIAIKDLDRGGVTTPVNLGNWHIYKVESRKEAADRQPLEGYHVKGITMEAEALKRGIKEYEVYEGWRTEANPVFDKDAMAIAGTRTEEAVAKAIPEMGQAADTQTRMGRAAVQVVPEFTDEEKAKTLMTYKIGDAKKTITLGDYQNILKETEGMETPKSGGATIEMFLKTRMHAERIAYEIEKRGYKTSREMEEYLAERAEELMVELLYTTEVADKVVDPTPPEVKEYFESHRSEFSQPPSVDVQHLIVGTEALANQLRQQLVAGQADFGTLAETHSISGWLKANKGIVTGYYQGEQRFPYLQEPAFRLKEGEISEPFAAPGGYALVKVLKAYPERLLTLEEVGDNVKSSVVAARREERLTQLLDEIRATVTVEIIEKNLQYVRDTAEVLKEKKGEETTVTTNLRGK
jgi:parvulin-like peptidyl-prolyl isomerase